MIFRGLKDSDNLYNKEICDKIGLVIYNNLMSDDDVKLAKEILKRIPYKRYLTKKYINFGYDFVYNKTGSNLRKIEDIPYELDIFKGKNIDINQLNIDIIEKNMGFTKVSNRSTFIGATFLYNLGETLYITFTNINSGIPYTVKLNDNTLLALSESFRNSYTYHMTPRKSFYFNGRRNHRDTNSYLFTYRTLDMFVS